MQFTLALTSTILALASGINALPQPAGQEVTIRIFNDMSGANAAATVPVGVAKPVTELFGTSAIASAGNIFGSSAQLTQFTDSTQCTLSRDGWVIQLDGRAKNFVDLDGNPAKATPIWLNGFIFQCQRA